MKLTRLGAALAAASIVVAACGGTGGDEAKTLKIGITLPLSGSSLASAGPARDGALLAIKEANAAGTIKGYTLVADIKDHAVNGVHDPQQGAKDMTTLVSDAAVMAVVGPFNFPAHLPNGHIVPLAMFFDFVSRANLGRKSCQGQ